MAVKMHVAAVRFMKSRRFDILVVTARSRLKPALTGPARTSIGKASYRWPNHPEDRAARCRQVDAGAAVAEDFAAAGRARGAGDRGRRRTQSVDDVIHMPSVRAGERGKDVGGYPYSKNSDTRTPNYQRPKESRGTTRNRMLEHPTKPIRRILLLISIAPSE